MGLMASTGSFDVWHSQFEDAARPKLTAQEYDALSIAEKEQILSSYGFHPFNAKYFINHDDPAMRLPRRIWEQFLQGAVKE